MYFTNNIIQIFITFYILLKTSTNFVTFQIVTPNFVQCYYISGCLEKNVAQHLSDNRGENVRGDRRDECGCYQITKI